MPHGTKEQVRQQKQRNKVNRRSFIESVKKESGCSLCGYKKSSQALHFHHVTSNKQFDLSGGTNIKRSIDSIKIEMSKCIIVCANCHAEIHAGLIKDFPNVMTVTFRDDESQLILDLK